MNISKDEFFREVTLRICSSLDIKAALKSCYNYMKEYLPLDFLFLSSIDESMGALRLIACEPESARKEVNEIVPLPKDIWEWQLSLFNPLLADSKNHNPMTVKMASITNNKGKSTLPIPLHIDGKKIGSLALRSLGDGIYNKNHLELVESIIEPFTIALANFLAHQEILSYRDRLIDDNRFLQKELSPQFSDDIIGSLSGLRDVMEQVRSVAPLNNTVLLLGETGAGKEVIANAIHYGSPRGGGPFIKVNCGAIPESLIDSELFGHEKGAFTGASAIKRGRFERSNGGTIFLDEIGELPLQAQVRLLRILQHKELERVGGSKQIPLDIRIIAATHRNLEKMVEEKTFREDLWFRLNVFPINIPPLRSRREDIPALTRYLVNKTSREIGLHTPPAIAIGALDKLTSYPWPGNIRELSNVIEREIIRFKGGVLTFDSITGGHSEPEILHLPEQNQPETMDKNTASYIRRVLKFTNGRINGKKGAAEIMGLKPSTLRSKMEKLGIAREDF